MGGPLSALYFVRELCPKRDNASIPATFFHQDLHTEFHITQTPHFTVIHAILGMLGRGWWRFLVQLSKRNRPVPSTISGCRRLPWRITDCRNYLNPLIKLYLHTHTRPACSLSFSFLNSWCFPRAVRLKAIWCQISVKGCWQHLLIKGKPHLSLLILL